MRLEISGNPATLNGLSGLGAIDPTNPEDLAMLDDATILRILNSLTVAQWERLASRLPRDGGGMGALGLKLKKVFRNVAKAVGPALPIAATVGGAAIGMPWLGTAAGAILSRIPTGGGGGGGNWTNAPGGGGAFVTQSPGIDQRTLMLVGGGLLLVLLLRRRGRR